MANWEQSQSNFLKNTKNAWENPIKIVRYKKLFVNLLFFPHFRQWWIVKGYVLIVSWKLYNRVSSTKIFDHNDYKTRFHYLHDNTNYFPRFCYWYNVLHIMFSCVVIFVRFTTDEMLIEQFFLEYVISCIAHNAETLRFFSLGIYLYWIEAIFIWVCILEI